MKETIAGLIPHTKSESISVLLLFLLSSNARRAFNAMCLSCFVPKICWITALFLCIIESNDRNRLSEQNVLFTVRYREKHTWQSISYITLPVNAHSSLCRFQMKRGTVNAAEISY